MPTPRKPLALKAGHSKGRKEAPRLGIVPKRDETKPAPKAPGGLGAPARSVWRAYWRSQVSAAADRDADMHRIDRWIKAVDEYDKVLEVFRKTRLVKGSTGQPVLNPLSAYLSALEGQISRAEHELGLTPMARLRLGITYGEAQLTALELNRQLDQLGQGEPAEVAELPAGEAWEAEWETA